MLALIAGKELPTTIFSPARYELRESCGYASAGPAGKRENLYSLGNSLERFGTIAYEHMLRDFEAVQLTFVDIDNMKGINDGLGHEEGDAVLRDTADVIRRSTAGENAFAMRYGGDEFLLISRRDLVPRLNEQLTLLKQSVDRPYDLSLSMGTIEACADERLSIDEAIRRADDKMYQIKRRKKAANAKASRS